MCKTVSKNAVLLMPVYVRCNVSFVRLNPVRWFEFSGMHLCRWFQLCPSSNIPNWFSRSMCEIRALSCSVFFFILSIFLSCYSVVSLFVWSKTSIWISCLEIVVESHLIVTVRVCLCMWEGVTETQHSAVSSFLSCLSSSGCNPNFLGEPL